MVRRTDAGAGQDARLTIAARARGGLSSSEPALRVDLDAIVANYRELASTVAPARCAAVVKADAYGLGLEPIARALAGRGCRAFFVTTADEGLALRRILPRATVFVLHGAPPGAERDCVRQRLCPVLHGLDAVERWAADERTRGFPAAVEVDTGMTRLGLDPADLERVRDTGVEVALVMSHLSCASDPDDPHNERQRAAFDRARAVLPCAAASLAASAGAFLGEEFHYDLVRPGAALFGLRPSPRCAGRIRDVVQLRATLVQIRRVAKGEPVGYDATFVTARPSRIGVLRIGYADGLPRSLGNRGHAIVGGHRAPIVGHVSMDLTTIDLTDVSDPAVAVGARVEIIGPDLPADSVAAAAGTIGYELLTSLGPRVHREHFGDRALHVQPEDRG